MDLKAHATTEGALLLLCSSECEQDYEQAVAAGMVPAFTGQSAPALTVPACQHCAGCGMVVRMSTRDCVLHDKACPAYLIGAHLPLAGQLVLLGVDGDEQWATAQRYADQFGERDPLMLAQAALTGWKRSA
jgi:hypothetical protein